MTNHSLFSMLNLFNRRKIRNVSPKEIQNKINSRQNFVLLDVRNSKAFSEGHIKNAVNIPFSNLRKLDQFPFSKNDDIVVSCHLGVSSRVAISVLSKRGFTNLSNLKGGMSAWNSASVKSSGRFPESINEMNLVLQAKYNITGLFYDISDYPWERQYRQWRPGLTKGLIGNVLEAGVGTGHNLKHYSPEAIVTGIDISKTMLKKAAKRAKDAAGKITLALEDATTMKSIPSSHFDWVFSTFLCCVMPNQLQPLAIEQFERILKPGGRFRLLEMVYSKNPRVRKVQQLIGPFVEKVYGARFDRNTLELLQKSPTLKVTNTYFLKRDVYLVIEGEKI